MNGITSRLQVFLAKIAGKDVDVSTLTPPVAINEEEKLMLDIADRIDAIESGGGLPTVTADDNGDVLTVVEGAWGKATPSGALLVTCTIGDNYLWTLDKTWAEIASAFTEGRNVVMNMTTTDPVAQGAYSVIGVLYAEDVVSYEVYVAFPFSTITFTTNSSDGYPVYDDNE